jgi:hypothetical protein
VQLFKLMRLASVPPDAVVRVLTSSGTTGQQPSRIVLDRDTAQAQSRTLLAIAQSFLGRTRRPMLVVDAREALRGDAMSARSAGFVGFSMLGRDHTFLLDERLAPQWDVLDAFAERHAGEPVLMFGFTFMVWRHLVEEARRAGRRYTFEGGVLVHGGGWKRLESERVSRDAFAGVLREQLGLAAVLNYYGMVEQTGSIFMECEAGRLHVPECAGVVVRDPATLAPVPRGESGVLQLLSTLPKSYPGHSILTEDTGRIVGEDDCACGRLGETIEVGSRLPRAELRGCSDVRDAA